MKNHVYSWRLDAHMKTALEEAARSQNTTVAGLLDGIVSEWLEQQASNDGDFEIQQKLHQAAAKCSGSIRGGVSGRSESVREAVREKLKRKRAR